MSDDIDLVPLLRQRLAQDMLPCEHNYWQALGLTPPGQDVGEVCHADSHARMDSVARYQAFVEIYSVLCADIVTEVMYKNLLDHLAEEMNTDVSLENATRWHGAARSQNREIVRSAVYPILAHMLEAGILKHGDAKEVRL